MQKAGRKSTRDGTGRRSPSSKTAASGSSASSRGSVSSASTERRSSNATLRAARSRSLNNPFQVSLNLVMKIQEMENKEFSMEPLALSLNDVNYLQNVQQKPQQKSSITKSSRRQQSEHAPSSSRSVPKQSDNDSVFLYDTPPATKKVDPIKNSEAEASAKSQENRFEELQRIAESALSTKKNNSLAINARSPVSRTSQTSSTGKKKKIQSTGNRYKNKQSLLRFASLQKPRSKSTGAALKFDKLYPRPRKLSFSDCEDSIASADESQVVGNGTKKSETDIAFPLDKTFRNSLDHGGLDITKSPNQSLTKSAARIVAENRTPTKEITAMVTPILDDTLSLDAKSDRRSSLPSNSSISLESNNPVNVVDVNRSITKEASPIAAARLFNTSKDVEIARRGSLASNMSMSFNECDRFDALCDVDVNQSAAATKIYDHFKTMRIGFIANGVHMAVNVKLNVRSDEETLYLEPVELLYEGNKMWRRSARQVAKEIEVQRMADKKKNLSNARMQLNESGTNGSFVTAPNGPTDKQATPSKKSISKNGTPARVEKVRRSSSDSAVKSTVAKRVSEDK